MFSFASTVTRDQPFTRNAGANEKHGLTFESVSRIGAETQTVGKVCKALVWWFESIPRLTLAALHAFPATSSAVELTAFPDFFSNSLTAR